MRKKVKCVTKKEVDIVHRPYHYTQFAIQPMEICFRDNLSGFQYEGLKYLMRYKAKNGVADLLKLKTWVDIAIHYETTGEFITPDKFYKKKDCSSTKRRIRYGKISNR